MAWMRAPVIQLFCCAIGGGVRAIIADLTTNVFPQYKAFSVRRNVDGTVRKTNRWIGRKYLQETELRWIHDAMLAATDFASPIHLYNSIYEELNYV